MVPEWSKNGSRVTHSCLSLRKSHSGTVLLLSRIWKSAGIYVQFLCNMGPRLFLDKMRMRGMREPYKSRYTKTFFVSVALFACAFIFREGWVADILILCVVGGWAYLLYLLFVGRSRDGDA